MSSTNSIPMNSPARSRALLGDKVLLVAALISGVAAAVIGYFYYEPMLGMVGGLLLSAMAAGVYFTARGTLFSRLALTTLQVALVALHIQLAHGEVEYHFGVFVTMSLLLVYLDWAPVLLAAALYAVHHVLFDRLQAAGLGFYCLSEPDFARVLLHAGYVVIQTGLEIVLLVGMGRMAKEGGELAAMVASVNQADGIALDVSGLRVSSPLAQSLQSTLQRMQTVVASVQQSTAHIETASEEISRGHQELASGTEAAASNLEQTAASMEEINSTMKSSADSARTASQLAVANAEVAQRGGQVVGQVVATMEEINQSSRKIHDIIGTIDGIAFQTNILALNAAVEAARAGEQGRGFAVVAGEVRNLAQRSAEAAKEIKGLIGTSVDKVDAGSRLVAEAGVTIGEVVANAQRVADMIGEITAASSEQSSGVTQVNTAINQLDHMTQQNAALVSQGNTAAQGLRHQADSLLRAVQVFKPARG